MVVHAVHKHLKTDYPLECLIHGGYWDRPCNNNKDCRNGKTGGCLTQVGGLCELPDGIYPARYHWTRT